MQDLHPQFHRLTRRLRPFAANFAAVAAWHTPDPLLQLVAAQPLRARSDSYAAPAKR
jgi:hypothetical protein